jgi:hypothetical protein
MNENVHEQEYIPSTFNARINAIDFLASKSSQFIG